MLGKVTKILTGDGEKLDVQELGEGQILRREGTHIVGEDDNGSIAVTLAPDTDTRTAVEVLRCIENQQARVIYLLEQHLGGGRSTADISAKDMQ